MTIFSKELKAKLLSVGYDHDAAICKVFSPLTNATWIIFGSDPEYPDCVSCVADLGFNCVESGSVLMSELEAIRVLGLPLELDRYFDPGLPMSHFLSLDTLVGV